MNIHCANNWLFHEWNDLGTCKRCGVPNGRNPVAETSVGDRSLFAVPSTGHLVGPSDRRDSVVRPLLRLVRGSRA